MDNLITALIRSPHHGENGTIANKFHQLYFHDKASIVYESPLR